MAPTAAPSTSDAAAWPAALVAGLAAAASLALFRPGLALYDTVAQYRQVVTSDYDDWHPPAMGRLWSLLAPLGEGAMPMLALQLALYWLGLGLIAAALRVGGHARGGWAVLAIGAMPLFLGWQGVVLKDAQLVGAVVAALGLVAWWRLRDRALPWPAIAAAGLLLGYAALVRANAIFAIAPLVAGLLPIRRLVMRAGVTVALALVVIAASGPINHRLLGATASGVEKAQPLFDLAGIAVRARAPEALPGVAVAQLGARHCVSPFFWDPLGDPAACGDLIAPVQERPPTALYLLLARRALHHPLAYATQRLAHWNATERWLVPVHLPGAAPPAAGEPNDLRLRDPGAPAAAWQQLAGLVAETPLGWPIAWFALALAMLPCAVRSPAGARRTLALALLASALCLEASFLIVSIAADLRYHLWPMLATALAFALLPPRRVGRAGWATIALVAGGGLAARAALPHAPDTYRAMLSWPGLPGTPHAR